MSKTLFIKANNRPSDQAVSVKMYDAFVKSYREHHPNDEFIELDLFEEHLPYYDNVMLTGIFKAIQGHELTPEEQTAVETADKYLNQFLAAEKIVFAFPLWNQTVPGVLHTYFDYLNRAGSTFRFTPEGAIGLATGKKVVILNARGGDYSGERAASEMAVNLVLSNLQLFGVTDITTVITEGHNQYPDRKEEIIQQGLEKAAKVAETF
ncbi:FMN-dependent NADH-azoreductase [Shimazuella sp. AN120528]|uniref:FMN-dependent NADH-azoreductase n=1 Tax=Shimazuella soli TaxID=1892854 RepID=UPI001F0DA39F|nr:FMN-dependent NADH-azoreductase [Shimazuella soli]MCH5584518.1 FMN-dependent NADH-azoreductase [Shimazuella soli]